MPQPERREALPVHPVPAGLVTLEAWRLRADGLTAQPLALSLREVDALEAQAHAADVVCEEGWVVPRSSGQGLQARPSWRVLAYSPRPAFFKVYAGDSTMLLPLEAALPVGALLRLVAPGWAGAPSAGQEAHLLDSTHRVIAVIASSTLR